MTSFDTTGSGDKKHGIDDQGSTAMNKKISSLELDVTRLQWILKWYQAFPTLLLLESDDQKNNTNSIAYRSLNDRGENDARSLTDEFFTIRCGETAFNSLFDPYNDDGGSLLRRGGENGPQLGADHRTDELNNDDNNLGYGEITPLSVLTCIARIQSLHYRRHQKPFSGRKIVDLGSGNGKVLFAACCLGGYTFEHAVGVEIVGELHDEATRYLNVWNVEWNWLYCNGGDNEDSDGRCSNIALRRRTSTLSSRDVCVMTEENFQNEPLGCAFEERKRPVQLFRRRTKFTFLHQDFTATADDPKTKNMFSDSSVIIVHCTLFDSNLMSHVQKICEDCDRGTYFVMVTKALNPFSIKRNDAEKIGNGRLFETLSKCEMEMNWGKTTVYIQYKSR